MVLIATWHSQHFTKQGIYPYKPYCSGRHLVYTYYRSGLKSVFTVGSIPPTMTFPSPDTDWINFSSGMKPRSVDRTGHFLKSLSSCDTGTVHIYICIRTYATVQSRRYFLQLYTKYISLFILVRLGSTIRDWGPLIGFLR